MRVVHCKKEPYDVYIGRPSIWGNPFPIGVRAGKRARAEVINKYKGYFLFRINNDEDFRERTLQLKGKILGCWCAPNACHGDVIVEWLEGQDG